VKLLFDQHFSYRLVNQLGDLFPGSNQVRLLGMARHSDSDIWYYAQYHGYVLVTRDEDLVELGILRGAPPKIVWVRIGNSRTSDVERLLRQSFEDIAELVASPERVILELVDRPAN